MSCTSAWTVLCTGLSRLFLNQSHFPKKKLILPENKQHWSMRLVGCACVVYFPLLYPSERLRPALKGADTWNTILLCDGSGALDASRLQRESDRRLSCGSLPCSQIRIPQRSCSGAPYDIPTSSSGQAPRLRAALTTCHAHMQQACAQLRMRSNMRRLKKTTTQLLNYRLQSFTIWEQKSRFM